MCLQIYSYECDAFFEENLYTKDTFTFNINKSRKKIKNITLFSKLGIFKDNHLKCDSIVL
jgi:hypothetical protein